MVTCLIADKIGSADVGVANSLDLFSKHIIVSTWLQQIQEHTFFYCIV